MYNIGSSIIGSGYRSLNRANISNVNTVQTAGIHSLNGSKITNVTSVCITM